LWKGNGFEQVAPGLTVALLAPDGAGKTTVIGVLEHAPWPGGVRSVYMGFACRADLVSRLARLPGAALPVTWVRLAVAARHRARGRLVLFDRYPYDYLIQPSGLPWLRRAHRWLLARACPRPDLVLVLDAPAAVLAARRPEHSVEELERRRQGYLALAARLPNAIVVDASGDVAEVSGRALTELTRRSRS
jgi:thymidylate kinase